MEMIEKLNIVEKCIPYVVDKSDENYGVYYLACYGLISKFGDEYLELIEKLFEDCEFFIKDAPLNYIIKLSGYNHAILPGEKACSFSSVCAGIDNQLNFILYEENPIVCVSTTDCTANEKLIIFTHEVSHIFKSMLNNVIKDPEKNTITIRRGFLLENIDPEDRDLNATYNNWVLDEIINVFQTADIMKSICDIDKELLDDTVREFFDTLDLDSLFIPSGYSSMVREFEPLWENRYFKNNVDFNVVSGDLESIENDFDGVVGIGKFREFSEALDYLFFNDKFSIKTINSARTIRNTIFNYNKKTNKKGNEKIKR